MEWKSKKDGISGVARGVSFEDFQAKVQEVLEEHGEKLEEDYWEKWERRGRMGAVSWVDAVSRRPSR